MRERTFKLSKDKTRTIHGEFGEQTRLAEQLGVQLATFSHYMHGRRHIPETLLMALCRATSSKPSDYLDHPLEKKLADDAFCS